MNGRKSRPLQVIIMNFYAFLRITWRVSNFHGARIISFATSITDNSMELIKIELFIVMSKFFGIKKIQSVVKIS